MPNYSKNDVLLVHYPFTDLSKVKVRPAVVVNASHPSEDSIIVPLTSRMSSLLPGEFKLESWADAGLNVPTAVKRGLYTIHPNLIIKCIGVLSEKDAQNLKRSLETWLGL
jgi:mRNA interferase MazF